MGYPRLPDLDLPPESRPETRKGYAFGNPLLDSDDLFPGWGLPVTPDELRYIAMFGTKLASPDDAQVYNDSMLLYYVAQAISQAEADLHFQIFPRWVRHDHQRDDDPEVKGTAADWIDPSTRIIRDSGYRAYNPSDSQWITIDLRHRPVRAVSSVQFRDFRDNLITESSFFKIKDRWGGMVMIEDPFAYGNHIYPTGARDARLPTGRQDYRDNPDGIWVDYETGYEKASQIPPELRNLIFWHAAIKLYNDFGNGKSPGLASGSVSLNTVSESYATTASATNALYGAPIIECRKSIDAWMKHNAGRFRDDFMFFG